MSVYILLLIVCGGPQIHKQGEKVREHIAAEAGLSAITNVGIASSFPNNCSSGCMAAYRHGLTESVTEVHYIAADTDHDKRLPGDES